MTPQALTALTGLSLDAVLEVRRSTQSPVSLDEPVQPIGVPLSDLVIGRERDPETVVIAREQEAALEEAVARLNGRQRRVVVGHWGLDGHRPRRLSSLAEELRLSRRRTQTIRRDALHKLRNELEPLRR